MKFRFLGTVFAVFLLAVSNLSANSIVFQIFQKDKSAEKILETTYLINQILVDTFYDFGCISCDNPAVVYKDEATSENIIHKDLVDAAESYMDFLVIVEIDYDRSKLLSPEAVQLDGITNISWESIKVAVNETVDKGSAKPNLNASVNKNMGIKEKRNEVQKFVSKMAKEIQIALKK